MIKEKQQTLLKQIR